MCVARVVHIRAHPQEREDRLSEREGPLSDSDRDDVDEEEEEYARAKGKPVESERRSLKKGSVRETTSRTSTPARSMVLAA